MTQRFSNQARASLIAPIGSTDTSLFVEADKGNLFPVADTGLADISAENNWFKLTLQSADGTIEIVYVRTRANNSDVLSDLLRGQEGTVAGAFAAGSVVGLRVTALDMESIGNIESALIAING